jgi:AAA domain
VSLPTAIIPTEEQQAILNAAASRRNLLIAALAGTGKTSTLKMIAETYPKRRGLYLSYNKALQLEAKAKFPSHIDCKTIHGLAYSQIGSLYTAQLQRKLDNKMIVEAFEIHDFRKGRYFANASLIASAAFDMVKNFCHSTKEQIEPIHYSRRLVDILIGKYKELPFDLSCLSYPKTFLEHFISLSYQYAQQLWVAMVDKDNETIPATHDIYLKLYQLSKPSIQGYDYIMLDEAQDANPSILDILSHQQIQRIYVGDKNQQIYEFRGTINAMSQIEGDLYYLTQSFRFGPAIATLANKVLKNLGETQLLKGYPSINSKIGPVNKNQPYAFLARTNAGLFEEILKLETLGKKVHFIGDIDKVIHSFESA